LSAELSEARAELVAVARVGRSEGASVRAIAEAVGLSRPRVHDLLNHKAASLQAVESIDGGSKC